MAIRIRPAIAADAATIARLARDLNAHQGDPVDRFTEAVIRRDGFGRAPEFSVILAERPEGQAGDPDAAIGYALYYRCYETGHAARGLYLNDLFICPDYRGRGAGRALIAAVAAEARRQRRTFVWWTSRAWNEPAQRAYRALGAIEEPVRAHAIVHGVFAALADQGNDRGGEPGC